jgi:hypothetical protein
MAASTFPHWISLTQQEPFRGAVAWAVTTGTVGIGTTATVGGTFIADETITADRLLINVATVTGTPGTLLYGIYNTTTANTPGTAISTSTSASAALTTGWKTLTGLSASLTKGVTYHYRIGPNAAWGTGNTITVPRLMSGHHQWSNTHRNVYPILGTTVGQGVPTFAYGTSSAWYGYPSFEAQADDSVSSGGSNTQIGISFTMVSGVSYKIRSLVVSAFRYGFVTPVAGSFILYSSDGTTVLDSNTLDFAQTRSGTQTRDTFRFVLDTCPVLTGGTKYYLVVQSNGGANLDMRTLSVNDVAYWNAAGLHGSTLVTRSGNTGAFTETTTKRVCGGVEIEYVDTATAGGGIIVPQGMSGGISG